MAKNITSKEIDELKNEIFFYQLFQKENYELIDRKISDEFIKKISTTLNNISVILSDEIKTLKANINKIDTCKSFNTLISIAKQSHINLNLDKTLDLKYNKETLKNYLTDEVKYKLNLLGIMNHLYSGCDFGKYDRNVKLNTLWNCLNDFQKTSNKYGYSFYSRGKNKKTDEYMFNKIINQYWSNVDIDYLKHEISNKKNIKEIYDFYSLLATYTDYANLDYDDFSDSYIDPYDRKELKNKYYPRILESVAHSPSLYDLTSLSKEDLKTIEYYNKITNDNWYESDKTKFMKYIYHKPNNFIKELADFYANKKYSDYHDTFLSRKDIRNIIEFFNNKDFSHYRNVQLSLTEITKILNFFKSYNIDYNKDVKWSIETIEAINKSIKNYVKHNITSSNYKTKHTIKINIKPAIEKISYFYNTYKQYQGHFVDIKNIDYMKKFMEEYPMYNHSIISVDNMIAMEEEMQNLNNNKQKSSALRDLYEIKNLIDYYKKTNENVSSTWRYTISNYLRISSKNLTTEILEMENLVNNIKNCNSMDDLITIAQRNNISDIKPLDNLKEQKEHLIRGTVKQLGKHKQLLDILNRIDIDFDKKRNLTLSTISDFLDNYKTTGNLFKTTDIRLPILKEFITNDKYSYYKNNNLSNDEILEIVGFFNAIPINEKRHEWNLSTIRKINKSIKKSTMVYENNKIVYKNIEEKREKLSNFYNTYKQYRGQFVDVNYVDYMDNFMKKNPSLKYSLVTATEMSIIDKLPLSSRKKAINNLVSEKSSIRLQRLRAKIRRLINKLSIKDLANKVFKRKNPVLKQEKNQKIQQIKSQTINKEL